MIKLIACDMDGTLLDGEGLVPPETFGLIRELAEVGVRFCVSSGRDHPLLLDNFAPVADEMDYVCSNGAEVYVAGECLQEEFFSVEAVRRVAEVTNLFDAHHLFLTSEEGILCCDDTQEKFDRLLPLLAGRNDGDLAHAQRRVPRPGERVTTGWFITELPQEIQDFAYVLNLELGDLFTFNYTNVGMDFSTKGITKATGIAKVMAHYGLSADEVMAYGDSMNDYEILREVGHPTVVANAFYPPKQVSERVVESNLEHGVQRDLRRVIDDIRAGGSGVPAFDARGGGRA